MRDDELFWCVIGAFLGTLLFYLGIMVVVITDHPIKPFWPVNVVAVLIWMAVFGVGVLHCRRT